MIPYVLNLCDLACTLYALAHGGVELPKLPEYDTAAYPYAIINSFTGEYLDNFLTENGYDTLVGVVDVLYSLRVISKPYHNYPDDGWSVGGSISLKRYIMLVYRNGCLSATIQPLGLQYYLLTK